MHTKTSFTLIENLIGCQCDTLQKIFVTEMLHERVLFRLDGTGSVAHYLKLKIIHCMGVLLSLSVSRTVELIALCYQKYRHYSYVLQSVIDMNNASFLKSTEAQSSLS